MTKLIDDKNKCDICGSTDNVKAGRWIFYCPAHKRDNYEFGFKLGKALGAQIKVRIEKNKEVYHALGRRHISKKTGTKQWKMN